MPVLGRPACYASLQHLHCPYLMGGVASHKRGVHLKPMTRNVQLQQYQEQHEPSGVGFA